MKHSSVPYSCRALLGRATRARVLLLLLLLLVVGFDWGGWRGAARHGTAAAACGSVGSGSDLTDSSKYTVCNARTIVTPACNHEAAA